jgi:hypothetical protein
MNHSARVFLFTNYWWITIIAIALLVPMVTTFSRTEAITPNLVSLFAAGLGVVYFVQKQKLEETQLFQRLFIDFNTRYEKLNDRLQKILGDATLDQSSVFFRNTLDDYFNLCAEEYLFYSQGRILPVVWRSWCMGMLQYLKDTRISQYWNSQERMNSHYGLTLDRIREGGNSR